MYKLEFAAGSATTLFWLTPCSCFWVCSEVVNLKLASSFMSRNDLLQVLEMYLQQRSHILASYLRTFKIVGNLLFMDKAVQEILRRMVISGGAPDGLFSSPQSGATYHLYQFYRLIFFHKFWIDGNPHLQEVCLTCLRITIISLSAIFHYFMIIHGLTLHLL